MEKSWQKTSQNIDRKKLKGGNIEVTMSNIRLKGDTKRPRKHRPKVVLINPEL